MHVVAAPDKFRGTLTAVEAAAAIAAAAEELGWSCAAVPLADGGEGTLEALGGSNRATRVTGPLGAVVDAGWRLADGVAVVEMARASGLELAGGKERNDPVRATTAGTGELIEAAIADGATRVVVGVGGSATTDGGLGAVDALGWAPFAERGVRVQVACDVETAFLDAPAVFGPQKGADPAQVEQLTERLRALAARYAERLGVDVTELPRAGAAGGLAGGLAALGAELLPGFEVIADASCLDAELDAAQLAVTGEGRLDTTSFAGKVVGGVAARAAARGVPVVAICGDVAPGAGGRLPVVSLAARYGMERAFRETAACVADAARELLAERAARAG